MNKNLDTKTQAKYLYWQGWKITAIAKAVGEKATTVYSWCARENWKGTAPLDKVAACVESRLIHLISTPDKTAAEYKEIKELERLLVSVSRPKESKEDKSHHNPNGRSGGRRKISTVKNHFEPEQIEKLQAYLNERRFDYQRQAVKDANLYRNYIALKSRQIGFTDVFSGYALEDALLTGRNKIFLSASLKQSMTFKNNIKKLAMAAEVELEGDVIVLSNGAELHFLSTNSSTSQGRSGDVIIDEFAWIPKFMELRKLAGAMAMHTKFRRYFISTPSTKTSEAFVFWSGEYFKKRKNNTDAVFDLNFKKLQSGLLAPDNHFRKIITIHDAIAGGCDLFDLNELMEEYSSDEFAQLFMCEWLSDGDSVFSMDLLNSCRVDTYEEWADFYKPFTARPVGNRKVWIGYDPTENRTENSDAAGLVVMLPPENSKGKWRLIETRSITGMDYEQQAALIKEYTQIYNVEKIVMDTTGIGGAVSLIVKGFFCNVTELNYSNELKAQMITKALKIMKDRRFEFDSGNTDFMRAMMSIKRKLTPSGTGVTYVSDRSKELSHSDTAWAALNVLNEESWDGSTDGGGNTEVVIY